jgi:hypothetical protein
MRGRSGKNAKNHERARGDHETPDIISRRDEGYIEGQKMSGETAAEPALPIDIILPQTELFCFSGQVCKFSQGDRIFNDLNFDATTLHS